MTKKIETVYSDGIHFEVVQGKTDKTKSGSWTGLKITIGEWSKLYFIETPFELKYIKNELGIED